MIHQYQVATVTQRWAAKLNMTSNLYLPLFRLDIISALSVASSQFERTISNYMNSVRKLTAEKEQRKAERRELAQLKQKLRRMGSYWRSLWNRPIPSIMSYCICLQSNRFKNNDRFFLWNNVFFSWQKKESLTTLKLWYLEYVSSRIPPQYINGCN